MIKRVLMFLIAIIIIIVIIVSICFISIKNLEKEHNYYRLFNMYEKNGWFNKLFCNKNLSVEFYFTMVNHNKWEDSISSEWILPEITGLSAAEVACAFKNMGQNYEIVFKHDKNYGYNEVVEQYPLCGEEITADKKVIVTVNSYYGNEPKELKGLFLGRYFLEIGEWVYFTVSGESIYRSHIDFSDIEKIYTCDRAEMYSLDSLMGMNDKIYFIEKDTNGVFNLMELSVEDNNDFSILELTKNVYKGNLMNGNILVSKSNFIKDEKYYEAILKDDINSRTLYFNIPIINSNDEYNFIIYRNEINNYELISSKFSTYKANELQIVYDKNNIYILLDGQSEFCDKIIEYDIKNDKYTEIYTGEFEDVTMLCIWNSQLKFFVKEKDNLNDYLCLYTFDLNSRETTKLEIFEDGSRAFIAGSKNVCGNYLISVNPFGTLQVFNLLTNKFEDLDYIWEKIQ